MNCKSGFFNIESGKCINPNEDFRTVSDLAKDSAESLVNKGIEGFDMIDMRLKSKQSFNNNSNNSKICIICISLIILGLIIFFGLRNRIL